MAAERLSPPLTMKINVLIKDIFHSNIKIYVNIKRYPDGDGVHIFLFSLKVVQMFAPEINRHLGENGFDFMFFRNNLKVIIRNYHMHYATTNKMVSVIKRKHKKYMESSCLTSYLYCLFFFISFHLYIYAISNQHFVHNEIRKLFGENVRENVKKVFLFV